MAAACEGHADGDQTRDEQAAAQNERALGRGTRDQRAGDPVTGQPKQRKIALASELVLQIQKLISVSLVDPRGVQPKQHPPQALAHVSCASTRSNPTCAIR
jgi:hypothetical protein